VAARSWNRYIYRPYYQNLDYVACGDVQENAVELLFPRDSIAFLARVKYQYDVVIFDSPSLNAAVDAGILAARTDAVILVAPAGKNADNADSSGAVGTPKTSAQTF
jgi:Mrp family chromosome partitioning ATPase